MSVPDNVSIRTRLRVLYYASLRCDATTRTNIYGFTQRALSEWDEFGYADTQEWLGNGWVLKEMVETLKFYEEKVIAYLVSQERERREKEKEKEKEDNKETDKDFDW